MPAVIAVPTLANATSGTGATIDFGQMFSNVTMQVNVNGTVTGGIVAIDVSMDGVNFVTTSFTYPLATGANQKVSISEEAWRFARARITTPITGGGSVTVFMSFGGF